MKELFKDIIDVKIITVPYGTDENVYHISIPVIDKGNVVFGAGFFEAKIEQHNMN